jgi:hypothetical protein
MPAPTFHWRFAGGETLLNHNAAVQLSDSTMVFDSLPYAKDYTMIVVYRPDTNGETSLWQLTFGDGAMRGLMNNNVMH